MRLLTGFLTLLFVLAACAAPMQPATVPVKTVSPKSPAIALDGTFRTSLLAVVPHTSPRDNVLLPINPASGAALPGYAPISLGATYFQAFSPDRHTLAVVSYPNDLVDKGKLLVIDVPNWKTRRFSLDLAGWVNAIAFSPDGKRLAIAHGDVDRKLIVLDVADGTVLAQSKTEALIRSLKFTESGRELMLYSQAAGNEPKGPPQVRLLDATDLSPHWSAELEGVHDGLLPKDETITQLELYEPGNSSYLSPSLNFAPGSDTLYIVHADVDQLTTVDFQAQTTKTVNIQTKLSWFGQLLSHTAGVAHAKGEGTSKQAVLSPDGRFLYVVGVKDTVVQDGQGNFQLQHTPLGLDIVQTSDGSRLEHVDTDSTEVSISPDGRFLYLRNWVDTDPWSEIFDSADHKILVRKEKLYAAPTSLIDGQFLLASTYMYYEDKNRMRAKYHMTILQPSDLGVVAEWTGSEFIYWLPAK